MPDPDYTLIQISDTHLRTAGPLYGRVDTTARLRKALAMVVASELRPAALILTGDLADHGEPQAYDRLRELVLPVVAELQTELICLAGNHDDRAALRAALLDGGAHDRVHRFGGLRVITLDTSLPGAGEHHGELDDEQLAWLARELEQPAPDGTILALHHPPLPSSLLMLEDVGLREPERLGDVIAGTDVRLVIAGHNHVASCGTTGGVPVWVSPALAYSIDPSAPAGRARAVTPAGFTRIDVYAGQPVASQVPISVETPILDLDPDGLRAMIEQYA